MLPIAALLLVATLPTAALAQDAGGSKGFEVTTLAEGLDHPWGIAPLPDGSMLVTERRGRLLHVGADGTLGKPIDGVPEVDARGQGGLLDITLHPDFSDNRLVYLSFAEKGEGGNSTAVARGSLAEDNRSLRNVEIVFSQKPKVRSNMHFGSRIVFDREGRVYVGLGERSHNRFRVQAQDLNSHLGKVVRLADDGSVPRDNPFVGRNDALPEIWSYGHRNIQAAALHPETGKLWTIEHGPKGGDEMNIPKPGGNYGWPVVSLRRQLQRHAGRQWKEGRAGHGGSDLHVDAGDRAVGHDLLQRQGVSGVERRPLRRRIEGGRARAARPRG